MAKLTTQQKKALRGLRSNRQGFSCQGTLGMFLDTWLICEIIAKRLLQYRTGKEGERWSYTEVEASLRYFEIPLQDENLSKLIFKSGKAKEGERTPRQLRNAYLHSLSKSAIKEIESRCSSIVLIMENWLDSVTKA